LQTAIAIAQSQKARSFRTARRAVSGEALRSDQSRRQCARRACAGGRGLPADPTIPRTHPGPRSLGPRFVSALPTVPRMPPPSRLRTRNGGRPSVIGSGERASGAASWR
jgi:hypothetical protein